jgi:hypothetical protein
MNMQPFQISQAGAVKCKKDSGRYQEALIRWRKY